MKTHIFIAAMFLGGAGLAHAQGAAGLSEVEDDDRMVEVFGLSVDDVEDMDIVDASGREIAEVEEILMNEAGEIVAVAAELDDLFQLDDVEVVIPLDQLSVSGDDLATSLTEEQVRDLEEWDD